jgi:hypothetical protein
VPIRFILGCESSDPKRLRFSSFPFIYAAIAEFVVLHETDY